MNIIQNYVNVIKCPLCNGNAGTEYEYTFKSTSPLGRDVYYYITWGDGSVKNWFGTFSSSEEVKVTHTFSNQGTHTIKARAKDTENLWGSWGELEVNMPRDKAMSSSQLLRYFDRFPIIHNIFLIFLIKNYNNFLYENLLL